MEVGWTDERVTDGTKDWLTDAQWVENTAEKNEKIRQRGFGKIWQRIT